MQQVIALKDCCSFTVQNWLPAYFFQQPFQDTVNIYALTLYMWHLLFSPTKYESNVRLCAIGKTSLKFGVTLLTQLIRFILQSWGVRPRILPGWDSSPLHFF